jgi:hypothetical protein
MAARQVRATLRGYALWALDKYKQANGIAEGPALAAIVQRWLDAEDEESLARFGISLQAFNGAEIVPMGRKRRSRPSEPA